MFGLINYIELCEIRNHDPALILIFIISDRDMFFVYLWNLSFGIWNGTSLKDMSFRFMIFHLESLEDISA